WSPSAPSESDDITVRGTVRNIGTAPSAATTVQVSLGGVAVGSAPVGPLAAGASAPVSVAAGKRAQGSYTVSALVDPNDTIAESDETNNSRTTASPLVVGRSPGPDLEVRAITPSPANPAVGAAVSFTVAVHNRGTSAVSAGTVTRLTVGST
ncbi:CARDB domain-containing protein, partial [Streptomyces edwardsiae]